MNQDKMRHNLKRIALILRLLQDEFDKLYDDSTEEKVDEQDNNSDAD